ncbi:MAG: DNA-directed RNA polymerase subunit beta, partial [Candidatus Colwellbacteria bacterium]|nr:DNA-directed RNA polymerase subunit beta [Candidatus Colwellbacteria bacterium]
MPKLPVKKFSSHPGAPMEQPNLFSIQTDSYKWFRDKGIAELFEEISPIKSYTGDLELYFLDYYFGEPKYTEKEVYFKGITYEAPLRARLKLVNKKTGKTKEQEIYLGDFPIMTDKGTFIINGVERVVISQIIRSPGAYFTVNVYRGRRLFGAKVIPNRGVWLEFETDPDGFIGVKIDRHRKVAATDLLRIFGMGEEEISSTFGEAIKATLRKDGAKNISDSYLEVYKRIRPGDLATTDDAKKLIDAMFTDPARYDLSSVGRFKFNQRLQDGNSSSRLLGLNDLIKVIKEILALNVNPKAEADDIDHLGNRRVRSVGELLQSRLRIGFARLRRNIQDKMSTLEPELMGPVALVNPRPLTAIVREFFSSSPVSQFMDQDNPLSEVEHKRRLTALGPGGLTRERASIEVRDVHESYYGKICPIQSPEGQSIGLVNHFTNFARLNEYGFLMTPYIKVEKGKLTGKISWLDAVAEEKYKIAASNVKFDKQGNIIESHVDARIGGRPGTCSVSEVDFIDIAPTQLLSVATSLVPFLEHDDANRALMASNMQKQAVPSIKPQAPYVGTGMEDIVARDSGYLVTADSDGVVSEIDGSHITVKDASGKTKDYQLIKFKKSNKDMAVSQRPLVSKGDKVKKGDILADGHAMDHGTLALGQN